MSLRTTSGTTLVVIKHGTVATSPTSSTDGTHALGMGLSGEDAGEDVGHVLGACYNLFLGVPRTIKDIPQGGSIRVGIGRQLQEPVKD